MLIAPAEELWIEWHTQGEMVSEFIDTILNTGDKGMIKVIVCLAQGNQSYYQMKHLSIKITL